MLRAPCRLYDWLLQDAQLGYTLDEEKQALQCMEQLRAVLRRQAEEGALPVAESALQQPPAPQVQLLQAAAGQAATDAALMQQYEPGAAPPRLAPPAPAAESMLSDSETM